VPAYTSEEIEASPSFLKQHRIYSKRICGAVLEAGGKCPDAERHLRSMSEREVRDAIALLRTGGVS
jgi:hypothetical protein